MTSIKNSRILEAKILTEDEKLVSVRNSSEAQVSARSSLKQLSIRNSSKLISIFNLADRHIINYFDEDQQKTTEGRISAVTVN
ncbi:hypothetical protein C0J52_10569 [Blattella germanica]|nr:hypothetical protein C0J52_10569 [Blattella germanica]